MVGERQRNQAGTALTFGRHRSRSYSEQFSRNLFREDGSGRAQPLDLSKVVLSTRTSTEHSGTGISGAIGDDKCRSSRVSHGRTLMTPCPPARATTATFQVGHATVNDRLLPRRQDAAEARDCEVAHGAPVHRDAAPSRLDDERLWPFGALTRALGAACGGHALRVMKVRGRMAPRPPTARLVRRRTRPRQ